eukprot:g29279.t1
MGRGTSRDSTRCSTKSAPETGAAERVYHDPPLSTSPNPSPQQGGFTTLLQHRFATRRRVQDGRQHFSRLRPADERQLEAIATSSKYRTISSAPQSSKTLQSWSASLTTRKKRGRMAEAQTVQPESLGGQRFRSMLPVLAWAPPTGTLRVESATSCCHVAIGRVDVLADGIRLGETVVNEGLAELEVLVPPRELEAAFQMSGRPLMQLKLDFRPGEERNVSEEIQVKVPVGVYIYMTPIILEEPSKLTGLGTASSSQR